MELQRGEVMKITGLSRYKTENLMREYGNRFANGYVISGERLNYLVETGVIDKIKHTKRKGCELEKSLIMERVFNLTLYLKFVKEEDPELWETMEDMFSGLPGYSEQILKRDGDLL